MEKENWEAEERREEEGIAIEDKNKGEQRSTVEKGIRLGWGREKKDSESSMGSVGGYLDGYRKRREREEDEEDS